MGQLEDLRAFVQIVEHESIGKAAEMSGVAKSAMSRKLRLLEERLKTELITRTTRQWALSVAGRGYYEKAVKIIAELEEADADISNEDCSLSGDIRISAPLHYGLSVLAPTFLNFADSHPGIRLQVDFQDRMVDLIGENFDLAIRISRLENSSMIARKLSETRHVVCASPAYLKRHAEIRAPDDLRSHSILQIGHAKRFQWHFSPPNGKTIDVALKSVFNTDNGEFLLMAAGRDKGIVRLPDFLADPAIKTGAIVQILHDYAIPPMGIYALYPESRYLTKRVRTLIDHLVMHC